MAGRLLIEQANVLDDGSMAPETRTRVLETLRLPEWAGQIGIGPGRYGLSSEWMDSASRVT
jgi:hypothetical protein